VNGVDPLGLDALKRISNFAAGWGDTLTFGGTKHLRKWVGEAVGVGDANEAVDYQSGEYRGGQLVGTVHQMALTRRPVAPVAATTSFGVLAAQRAAACATGGFATFRHLKRVLGPAGPGYAWHHLVEQTPANIAKFGPKMIHNANNVLKLPHGKGTLHARISGLYSSKRHNITGSDTLTVRQWLASKSFEEQMEFGLKALDNIQKGIW
jgi:hypothetical protein